MSGGAVAVLDEAEVRAAMARRLREVCREALPLPAGGQSAERHRRLFEVAREDVSLSKLAEAHWDAVAILAEAGRAPREGAVYAVWASEVPGQPLVSRDGALSGTKAFCSGRGLVTHALVTVGGGDGRLLEVALAPDTVTRGAESWCTPAFAATDTGPVIFREVPLGEEAEVGPPGFYIGRPGFWHGACGPAACWAGGAAGLVDYARGHRRSDAHTMAHKGAMEAGVWALKALLTQAGEGMDADPAGYPAAQARAWMLRHSVETIATDILRRFARAFGPFPLAMEAATARRYAEVDLFLRQSHGERDLEELAVLLAEPRRGG